MPSQSLPDFDDLWDYSHPGQTEAKFRELLAHLQEDDPAFLELLTQIGRAQGLQQKFDHAHQTLDQVEQRLDLIPSRTKVRYLLERGRVFNSSGNTDTARSFFEEAFVLAKQLQEDFYSVDALHMLAIVAPPGQSLEGSSAAATWTICRPFCARRSTRRRSCERFSPPHAMPPATGFSFSICCPHERDRLPDTS